MVVLVVTKCPNKLHGDISKWLIEISPGVFTGNISKRVRERLWDRIRENLGPGNAVMVYNANTELGLEIKVYHTAWEPRDFDGITLMYRPSKPKTEDSDSFIQQQNIDQNPALPSKQSTRNTGQVDSLPSTYVSIDIETTGLDPDKAEIIEIGALLIENDQITDEFSCLISREDNEVPEEIEKLTGITEKILNEKGIPLYDALYGFKKFIQNYPLIGHSVLFDISFLNRAYSDFDDEVKDHLLVDTLELAKGKIKSSGYSLQKICEYFKVARDEPHRALSDAKDVYQIYTLLKKL